MTTNTKSVDNDIRSTVRPGLIILALVFLLNPVVRVVDVLPDFIACAILIRALGYAADRAPFFEEARNGLFRLAAISLAKIPAFLIISLARSGNTLDNDTSVLFTFVFSVIETVVLFGAVNNIFAGTFYLGERSDLPSSIRPFSYSRGKKQMTPEALRIYAFVFVAVRAALTALPELLLLTRSSDGGKYLINPMALYPYFIVLSVITVLVLGVIGAKRSAGYINAIKADGKFLRSIDRLISGERITELEKKIAGKHMRTALTALIIAAFFTVELRVDNLSSVNVIPHFAFGISLMIGIYLVGRYVGSYRRALISAGVYSILGLISFILEISFTDKYGFGALVRDGAARDAYIPLIIVAALELCALTVTMVMLCLQLIEFSRRHTGLDPESERYGRQEQQFHRDTKKRVILYGISGGAVGLVKLMDVVFRYFSDRTYVALEDTIGTVVSGLVPWFGLILVIVCGIFIGMSLYVLGGLRNEAEEKYS